MKKDLFGELAHMIMAGEKSHYRLSTKWRCWNAGSGVQSKSEDLINRETDGIILSLG